jgi:hypothetical protein
MFLRFGLTEVLLQLGLTEALLQLEVLAGLPAGQRASYSVDVPAGQWGRFQSGVLLQLEVLAEVRAGQQAGCLTGVPLGQNRAVSRSVLADNELQQSQGLQQTGRSSLCATLSPPKIRGHPIVTLCRPTRKAIHR